MANEQIIDQVIAPVADEQVISLTRLLKDLDVVMAADIKTANALNSALANSKSFSDYNKNSANAALQLEKIQQAQIKTQASTVKLEETQAKAAAAQKARDEQAAQRLAQQEARQAASDAKQIAAAEAKAAKLQAIADKQQRATRDFPTGQSSTNPVTQDDSPAVRYEPIITGNEDMSATAIKSTEAIAAENAALLEQQEVLGSLTTAQRANIETLLALQAERAANATELKALNVEDAASGERAVFLTSEQIRLKIAISEVTVALNRQTKEALAADGAMKQLDQSVLLLRTAYEELSVSERESENGQRMLAELNALDAENKKLALTVGNTSKQIGDYEKGQAKASLATQLGDKIASQFTRSLIRMGVQFALITVAFGAVEWLAKWISGLDYFTGRLNQALQNLKALNEVMKNADSIAGDNIANLKILYAATQDVTLSEKERIEAAETLKRLYPDILKNSSDAAILNGEEAASIALITQNLIKEAEADAALQKIRTLSGQLLDAEFQKQKIRNAESNELARNRNNTFTTGQFTPVQSTAKQNVAFGAQQIRDRAKDALDLQNENEKIIQGQIDFLTKFAGVGNMASIIEKAPGKVKKASDKTNTELLEYYRLQLEEAKKQAKLIVDDDTQSYDTRKQALVVYLKASEQLVKNAEATALADRNISKQKRKNIELQFSNELLDVQRDAAAQRLSLQKQELAKVIEQSEESQEEQLYILDRGSKQALEALDKHKNELINAKIAERDAGKISEAQYTHDLLIINDKYNVARIQAEIQTQAAILGIREANRDATVFKMQQDGATPEDIAKFTKGANKGIQATQDTLSGLQDQSSDANSKLKGDEGKPVAKGKDKTKNAELFALEQTGKAVEELNNLRQKAYEAEMSRLEALGQQIDENANNEKLQVQNSIASNSTKAREISVIEAQAAAKHEALQAQENKVKHQADVADKEASIAKIILSTAEAAIKAPAELGPILGLAAVPVVLALGAVELALAVAAPLPKYAKGTKHYPGGLGIWGEAGIERATLPSGEVRFSSGAEIANFPKGTVITPHMELMRQIRPEQPVKFLGAEEIGWKDVLAQLKKMETKPAKNYIRVNVDNGFEQYQRNYLGR